MKRWIGAKTTRDGARLSVLGGDKCVSPDQEGPSASVKRRATVAKTPVSARALEQTVPGSAGFAPLHSGILTAAFVVTLIAFGRRSRGAGPIAFFGGKDAAGRMVRPGGSSGRSSWVRPPRNLR